VTEVWKQADVAVAEADAQRKSWLAFLLRSARPLSLNLLDQAAYGLATFMITGVVSRTTSPSEFARFFIFWSVAWTISAAASDLVVTPLRLAIPRGEVQRADVERLERFFTCAGLVLCVTGFVGGPFGYAPDVPQIAGFIAMPFACTAFSIRRASLYSRAAVATAASTSGVNFGITLVLVGLCILSGHQLATYGLPIAAIALCLPLLTRRSPASGQRGFKLLARACRTGFWFATNSIVRGLAFTSGLVALSAALRGSNATALLGRTFVMAAPVQLASSALPLLLMPRLLAAERIGAVALRRTIGVQLCMYLFAAFSGLVVFRIVFGEWKRLLLPSATHDPGFLAVSFLIFVILMTSWSSPVIQMLCHASTPLITTLSIAVPSLIAVALPLPSPLLAGVPYGLTLCIHVFLMVRYWKRLDPELRVLI